MANDTSSNSPAGMGALPDNITLRIIILAHRTRSNDDLYLVLNLNATVGTLRERIRDSLPEQPSPAQQRLIYQGRALEDDNAILRQVLRLDGNTVATSHVLHLVIRDTNPSSQTNTIPAPQSTAPLPPNSQANIRMPTGAHLAQTMNMPQLPQLPVMQQTPTPHNQLLESIHNQMHNQIHMMQHQMALNQANQAHGHQSHLPPQQPPTQQAMGPIQNPMLQSMQATRIAQNPAGSTPTAAQGLPVIHSAQIHLARPGQAIGNNALQANNIQRQGTGPVSVQETIGPNGERIRTVINNGATTFHVTNQHHLNPFERPASAPGLSPTSENVPTNTSTLPQPGINNINQRPRPIIAPFPTGIHMPPIPSFQPNIMPMPPTMPFMPMHTPATIQRQPTQTMAWLLSSSSGPQGIIFAPGHGYFTSQRSSENTTIQVPQSNNPQVSDTNNQHPGQAATGLPPMRAQLVQARAQTRQQQQPEQARPGDPRAAARPEANDNDMLNLIVQRGWLFLRLYMFIFVLSEPGTWRRFIMLSLAILVCILPRQNPVTSLFGTVRRHIDNLIGPPDLAQRREQQQPRDQQARFTVNQDQANHNDQQVQETNQRTQTNRRAPTRTMPTPEENARRLLREHENRNPNSLRNAIYRVEQAVALFLASLIPGVGERHVRAREEARRIVEEESRRRLEEQQRAEAEEQQHTNESRNENEVKNDVNVENTTSDPVEATGESSGVNTNPDGSGEGVRARFS